MITLIRNIIIGLVAVGLAFFSWWDALLSNYGSSTSRISSFLIADEPRVRVESHDRMVGKEDLPSPEPEVVKAIAVQALAQDPLNSTAVRHLSGQVGFQSDNRPDPELLGLAERVSRRDKETQLGKFFDQLLQGDAEGAFPYLDRLLTVRPGMIGNTLPQLIAMLELEEGKDLFREKLDRPWMQPFFLSAMSGVENPATVADFYLSFDDPPVFIGDDLLDKFASQLAEKGFYDRAVAIVVRAQTNASAIEQFEPNADTTLDNLAPLTWALASDVAGGAYLANAGLVDVQLDSGNRIVVLDRIFRPKASVKTLHMLIKRQTGPMALIKWSIRCYTDQKWQQVWESGWIRAERDALSMNIPSFCKTPRWRLEAQAGEGQRSSNFGFSIALD